MGIGTHTLSAGCRVGWVERAVLGGQTGQKGGFTHSGGKVGWVEERSSEGTCRSWVRLKVGMWEAGGMEHKNGVLVEHMENRHIAGAEKDRINWHQPVPDGATPSSSV